MSRRRLLLPTIAAVAVASSRDSHRRNSNNSPQHASLDLDDRSSLLPHRAMRYPRRRRVRHESTSVSPNPSDAWNPRQIRTLQSMSMAPSPASNVSNDFSILLDIEPLLPSQEPLNLSPRIINGDAASPSRFPYTASLVDQLQRHTCGGTLIAPDIILTAGHCSSFFDAAQIGRYDIVDQTTGYDFLVVETHVSHPLYANVIQNDFALAKLYGRATKTPVRINDSSDDGILQHGDYLTVMGWGVTIEGISSTQSDVLREVDIQYINNTKCDTSEGYFEGDYVTYEGFIEDNMMCAWSQNKDACQGDSGGPLIRKGSDAEEDLQVGIVSWGLGCAMSTFPGVYSRISAEFDWIRSNVCTMSADPPSYFQCEQVDGVSTNDEGNKIKVTLVIELDGTPEETSWILETDPTDFKARSGTFIEGTSFAPFGTYSYDELMVVKTLQVVPNQSYRLSLMDKNGDGLFERSDGEQSKFRLCYGSVSATDCLSADLNDDPSLLICGGIGTFSMATSVSCFIEDRSQALNVNIEESSSGSDLNDAKPPTFAPFFVPLTYDTPPSMPSASGSDSARSPQDANSPTMEPSSMIGSSRSDITNVASNSSMPRLCPLRQSMTVGLIAFFSSLYLIGAF